MFGGRHEANTMARIGEKRRACAHGGEMAAFAFDAQVFLDATLLSHQAHQRLGLVGIELIGDKEPGGLWIGLDGLGDVSGEVRFGARGSDAWGNDLTRGHVEIGDQTLRAMAAVFEFHAFYLAWSHG